MMGAVREWLASVVLVTLLLSVVQALLPEGSLRKIGSFTGGLLLVAVLLQPVSDFAWETLTFDWDGYERSIVVQRKQLDTDNRLQLQKIIEERTAAYISDKADALGLTVSVCVLAEENGDGIPIPVRAELTGIYSMELAAWIEEELGIPKERQVWHEGKN